MIAPAAAPLLQVRELSKSFGGVRALRGASFELRAGEVHALVGENGAGKSTLIWILTGALRADAGEIVLDGRPLHDHDPAAAKRAGIAAIYQQPALFPELSVEENLAIGVERTDRWGRVDWRERRRRAIELLARVGARIAPEREASELSMPEQQLVEIARALGADARVLILDEPTASLPESDARQLFEVIRELRTRGVGVIYISHRLEELPDIADRLTVLRDGRTIETRSMADVSRAQVIQMMIGRELDTIFPKRSVPVGETVLELERVGCRLSGIADVSLELKAGEIVGLAGLVGAGRTELARVLFGLTPADAGTIRIRGRAVALSSPADAIALGIGYVPEDRRSHGIVTDMSVSDNVTLASLDSLTRRGVLDRHRELCVSERYVTELGVKTPALFTRVASLSGGNQQKVALARWLMTRPSILILDEPTQGIDVGAKAEIHRLMGDLAAQGMAILMISSELPEVIGMSDRIAVMRAGTIAGTLERSAATPERILTLSLGG